MKNLRFLFVIGLLFISTVLFAFQGYEVVFNQISNSEMKLDFVLEDFRISEIMKNGAKKIKPIAEQTLAKAKKVLGVSF